MSQRTKQARAPKVRFVEAASSQIGQQWGHRSCDLCGKEFGRRADKRAWQSLADRLLDHFRSAHQPY